MKILNALCLSVSLIAGCALDHHAVHPVLVLPVIDDDNSDLGVADVVETDSGDTALVDDGAPDSHDEDVATDTTDATDVVEASEDVSPDDATDAPEDSPPADARVSCASHPCRPSDSCTDSPTFGAVCCYSQNCDATEHMCPLIPYGDGGFNSCLTTSCCVLPSMR